ncbi:MAG: ImmA/IrrE family metallo-endopeptidase [Planctomycetes bacterium]|nr:ImmA/IrrE family metallo-endopeptidase [Planctomycetota bacterium]MCB9825250.1 ImmA/IrrE family metallo-endopeptidase [Planctomycetota bacterium]MCB9828812.1 ImmA/IrrE family metallo-endopeptidase [Planctomycetota bacterium]
MTPATTFQGARLSMARHLRGLTQSELAERAGLSVQFISKLESEERSPSPEALSALAFSLGFGPQFLQRPIREAVTEETCHLRSRRSTPRRLKREIRYRAVLLLEIVGLIEQRVRLPAIAFPHISGEGGPEGIEAAAQKLRVAWGVAVDAPLGNLTRLIESKGAVVSSIHGTSRDVSAFSANPARPIIIRSSAIASASRNRFDLAHECGHLVMHRDIVTGDRATEGEADRFAGALMFPRSAVRREYGPRGYVDWDAIFLLKQRWGMSAAALVRRIWDTGCISYGHYRRANIAIRTKGWHLGEPFEPPPEQPELLKRAMAMMESRAPGSVAGMATQLGCPLEDLKIVLPEGAVPVRHDQREAPVLRMDLD